MSAFVFALLLLSLLPIVALAAFGAGYAVALRRARARLVGDRMDGAPLDPGVPAPEPARMAFTKSAEEGTTEWQREMLAVGDQMRAAGVRLVLFAHGSFVGDDPLAVAHVLEEALGPVSSVPGVPDVGRAIRGFTRANLSRLLGDLSNFPRDYVDAFARATGVGASDFVWSGENHHAARIQGAVRLARALALHGGGALRPGDRVLLIGHSHGGQLFAVLSQLAARTRGHEDLLAAAAARGEDLGALEEHLALVRRLAIDVVTFGTPPRYGFARAARFRVLHVVNHRGAQPRASSLLGLLHTKHGDYVHQLGGHGSDFPAPSGSERAANARLDAVLGKGAGLRVWLRHVAEGFRVSPEGRTVLVDYGDDARIVPNFLATGLGHSAYTRRDAMLFHARLVASELYPPGATGAGGSSERPLLPSARLATALTTARASVARLVR